MYPSTNPDSFLKESNAMGPSAARGKEEKQDACEAVEK
jgi:hypothetical protein